MGLLGFRSLGLQDFGRFKSFGFRLLALLIFGLSPGLLRLQLLSVASFLSVPKGVELRMQKGTMGSLYRGSL